MRDTSYQATDLNSVITKELLFGFTFALKKSNHIMYLEAKNATNACLYFKKNREHFKGTLSRRTYFWDLAVPCGSEMRIRLYSSTQTKMNIIFLFHSLLNATFKEILTLEHTRNCSLPKYRPTVIGHIIQTK